MVNYEAVYDGASYLLDPGYGSFTGYRVPTGSLGATTSIQTANQLKEVTNLLNQGMKQTEVSIVDPNVFEMIPKGQLNEINRLNKLVGAESSLHAPIIDPAGVTEQGWSEENREAAEKQFSNIIERAQELDENGNIPVTIHASAALPGSLKIPDKEKGEILHTMMAVNRETGQVTPLKREAKFYPRMGAEKLKEAKFQEPEEELRMANSSHWDNKLSELVFNKDRADQLINGAKQVIQSPDELKIIQQLPSFPKKVREEYMNALAIDPEKKVAITNYQNAEIFLTNSYQSIMGIFNQAYKYGDEEKKVQLREVSENFKPLMEEYNQTRDVAKFSDSVQGLINDVRMVAEGNPLDPRSKPVQMYMPVEEFAINKSSETLSNVALNAYGKFGDKAPIISVENPPYGGALSTGEDLKNLIVETREKFTKGLMAQGKSKGEAEKAAEKLIGATWDTSHISMIRKQGYGKEKITEETRKIAPFVKHVHYNDNFGHTHTDLPPGMGDVPLKDVMNELNKENFSGKMVFEGGNFFQHFQTSPHPFVLEGSGSPLYAMDMGPYWNQMTGAPANYMSGMGDINPQVHHSLYGAGFSNLPSELGGNIPGTQSRATGTPMA